MNNVHFAIPEIYGDSLSYYELLRKLVEKTNDLIDNYNTVPEQIAEAVTNLDASQLFSTVLNQLIHSIATDNTKSANAVKVYKKHDLLYATFNETVNLYESLIDFSTGTATELIPGTNIREVNISELFIELRKLIEINKNNIEAVTAVANENSAAITTIHDDITAIENKNTEQDNEISTLRTMISTPYNFKGDVASISALPASGEVNDTYYVQDVKYKVTWTGSAWVQSSLSEADYQTELSELKGDLTDLDEILNVKHLRTASVTTTGSYVRAIAFSGLSLIGGHSYTFTVKPVSVTTNEYYLYFVDANGTETVIDQKVDGNILYNFTPTEDMNNVSIKVASGASSEQTFECSWIENVGDNEISNVNTRIDNLFDGTKVVELSILDGHFVTGASGFEGTIGGDSESCATSFIPVRPNDKLRIDNVYLISNRSICAYDEERNFVEVIKKNSNVTSYKFTVPENCYYIRATGKKGVAPTVTFLSIPNNLDSLRIENPIATITNGYYITKYSGLEGAVDNSPDSAITDYIPVKSNSVINLYGIYNEGNRCTCCYDKNKNFVSILSSSNTRTNFSKNIKLPSNARYIRITSRRDVVPTIKYVNTIIDGTNVSNPYINGKELFDSALLKPVLTFIDDDTWSIEYVTRQKELCDRLGIKCSFACLTEQVEKNEGLLELLLSYELDGFPVIFHANQQINEYNTPTLDIVAEERDFVTGLQKMHKFGFSDYKIWCTPFGSAREDEKTLAYKWGFDGLVTSGFENAYNNPYEYSSRFAIKRNSLGSNTDKTASDIVDDVANIKLAIDNASECNGWVCISTHSAYDLYKNGEADDAMEQIVNYAISKGFEIRTVNEELRRRMPIYLYYEQF